MTAALFLRCDVCNADLTVASDDFAPGYGDDNVAVYAEDFVSLHAGIGGCQR